MKIVEDIKGDLEKYNGNIMCIPIYQPESEGYFIPPDDIVIYPDSDVEFDDIHDRRIENNYTNESDT